MLLTRAIPVPEPGDIPRHERFYYLELLRRAGLIERFPESDEIRLDGIGAAREAGAAHLSALGVAGPAIGISPGAAYGDAKRWLPERFAESGRQLAGTIGASVLVFGSAAERALCESVAEALRRGGIDAQKSGRRNQPAGVHRSGRGVPHLSDQRFRRDARRLRARRPDGGGIRRHRRYDHGPDRTAGARGPRTCRVQPVPAAGMPDRSPLHDAGDGGTRHRGSVDAAGAYAKRMDTRTKIVSPEAAPRGCTVVTGTFDVVLAEDARELAEIRASHPERPAAGGGVAARRIRCCRSARAPNWWRRYAW